MSKAVVMHETGGPEVLRWEYHDPGVPAAGEARIVHEAVGLNFIDVYHRTGLYPVPSLPAVLGLEGAGLVDEVGEGRDRGEEGRQGGLRRRTHRRLRPGSLHPRAPAGPAAGRDIDA